MSRIAACAVDLITYRLDRPMGGSGVSEVDLLTAVLTDDGGATGFGFSYVIAGGGAPLAPLCRSLADRFLVGEPVPAPQPAWRAMAKSFNRTGSGWNMLALAALDVALWDLTAKRAGRPLGVAMGGAPRAVPVYASGPFQPGMAPAAAADAALAATEAGFRGVKPRVGAMPQDDATIAAVRAALPADRFLMLDVNEKGDLARARRLLEVARDHGVLFVEEPLPASDLGGFRRLADGAPVTIATGEHLQTLAAFEPYVADRMAGILQPDLAMIGGLTPSLALAEVAAFHGLGVAPHFLPGLFVHLAAAAPAVTWLEDFALLEPMFDGLPEMASDGTITIDAEVPGHGLSLSDRARALRD